MNIDPNPRFCDIANGTGCRVTIFVAGCRNRCPGCFNLEAQSFNYGVPFTDKIKDEIYKHLAYDYIEGLSILGGEPFEPENQRSLLPFIEEVKRRFPTKNIWMWTGYKFNDDVDYGNFIPEMKGITTNILRKIDVLVDGPFVEKLKDISLKFRGSSNQRIIHFKPNSLEIERIES